MRNYKLIAIFVLALFLRLNYDIFISGYNYDELAIMSSAVQSFPFGIIKTVATNDYHAPLYQLIAHFFTYFKQPWLYLRILNLVFSLINIYVFYKIGCILKNKKTGFFCALIITVNHLAISTVSFVKFYCAAFLLCSLIIYYLIKILKYNNGYYKFAIFNSLLILTSTYGFIFSAICYMPLFIKNKNSKLYKSSIIAIIGLLLYCPILIFQLKINFENIFSPHSAYADFSLISLFNALNDFFAPLLNYCCNLKTVSSYAVALNFAQSYTKGIFNLNDLFNFIVFSLIPTAIAIYFIYRAIKKDKCNQKLFYTGSIFFIFFILLIKLELTGFIPIYLYPLALILLILLGCGAVSDKKINIFLFLVYITVNLFISNCYPPQKRDFSGIKPYFCFEEFLRANPNSKIIATSGGRFLKKYYKDRTIFDFDEEKMEGSFQKEYISLIFGDNVSGKIDKHNIFQIFKSLAESRYRSPEFEKYFIQNVYNKINKNEEIVFSFLAQEDSPFILKQDEYLQILKNKKYNPHLTKVNYNYMISDELNYINTDLLSYFIESYSYEYLIELMDKYFKRVKFEQYTRSDNDNYIKNYEDYSNNYSTLYLAQNANKSWIFVTYIKQ